MRQQTVAFGMPFLAIAVGLVVLVVGVFQGGLTSLALVGGAICVIGVFGLYAAASRASSVSP